jgi:hypothetical protein
MRTTKVFSVEDGSLEIHNGHIVLWHSPEIHIASTNNCDDTEYLLPSTLIRTPKSDEELAEEYIKEKFPKFIIPKTLEDIFLAGRESFGDKKFHLSEEDLEKLIEHSREQYWCYDNDEYLYVSSPSQIIASLNPPIYPHTITVEHDGDNYLWETLKASYE